MDVANGVISSTGGGVKLGVSDGGTGVRVGAAGSSVGVSVMVGDGMSVGSLVGVGVWVRVGSKVGVRVTVPGFAVATVESVSDNSESASELKSVGKAITTRVGNTSPLSGWHAVTVSSMIRMNNRLAFINC